MGQPGVVVSDDVAAGDERDLRDSIQHDVERLIEIAARLFAAIEQQITGMERDLTRPHGDLTDMRSQLVLKERLIRAAINLDASVHDIVLHLGERAARPS